MAVVAVPDQEDIQAPDEGAEPLLDVLDRDVEVGDARLLLLFFLWSLLYYRLLSAASYKGFYILEN